MNKAWFAIVQMSRMFPMAILAIPIPYTMDPNIYGVAFRRMGASDKFSFAMDLAFRFIPYLSRAISRLPWMHNARAAMKWKR